MSTPLPKRLVELHRNAVDRGDKWYFDPDTGFLVMTELHHLERGTCCERGCRHCPYGPYGESASSG